MRFSEWSKAGPDPVNLGNLGDQLYKAAKDAGLREADGEIEECIRSMNESFGEFLKRMYN
jgi:hypothetical protein